jgi:hypothetical protein
MTKRSPFRSFKTGPEIIRLAVMMYVRFSLSLRNVEDLLHERGIDISYETVRFLWNRFGPLFAAEIRKKRVSQMRAYSNWQWHMNGSILDGCWPFAYGHSIFNLTIRAAMLNGFTALSISRALSEENWLRRAGRFCSFVG